MITSVRFTCTLAALGRRLRRAMGCTGAALAISLGLALPGAAFAATPSIHDRAAWLAALQAKDLDTLTQMFAQARERRYPSVPNDIALAIALQPEKLPAAARDAAGIQEFQVEALAYLALAHRNRVMEGHRDKLRALARRFPRDGQALRAIAHLQDRRDVPFLAEASRDPEPNRYRPALYALAVMCLDEARAALADVERSAREEAKKAFVREVKRADALCGPPR